jgi:hypothetical protein
MIMRKLVCTLALLTAMDCALAQSALPRMKSGKPDLNGIWQATNEANWNLEAHNASQGAVETLGAIGAVAPGVGVVDGGKIPYLPAALSQRQRNFTERRTEDPEAKCFMPGVPRATYLPYPFQIVQSDSDLMIVYQFAGAVRSIPIEDRGEAPVDSWLGWQHAGGRGDRPQRQLAGSQRQLCDRNPQGDRALHAH